MKMNVLTVAVLAALTSGSVLAASEGGDTWSKVQPVQQSTYSALPSASRLDVAFQGSEGGDTWSSVQALPRSFAPGGSRAVSGTGSTDLWSNDFRGLVGGSPSTIVNAGL
jgi:hypothetical protein